MYEAFVVTPGNRTRDLPRTEDRVLTNRANPSSQILGQRITTVGGIPDSIKATIPDFLRKMFPDFGLHNQKISRIPESGLPYNSAKQP